MSACCLVCLVLALSTTVSAFTILNPWTGRVEFTLSESDDNNRVAAGPEADIDGNSNAKPDERLLFETREEYSEYLTPDGTPKYKLYKYSPYGHSRG